MKKSEYTDISKRVKEIRLKNNLTQKEFAKLIGLSAPAVGAIENGLYTPNFNVLRIIKQKFFIEYDYIIDGEINNLRQENLKLKKEVDRLAKVIDKLVK
jgi:transcriptional regulator with XRE-family HTH domain